MRALVLMLALASVGADCNGKPQPATPTTPAEKPLVFLGSKDGDTVQVSVEVVDTPSTRQTGLMNRAQLAEDAGMLFLVPKESVLTFWMKDTLIALDMIFIRADMSVAGIVENAAPMTTTTRSVNAAAQFVLEVNGGFAARHGIVAGSRVRFENVPAAPKD